MAKATGSNIAQSWMERFRRCRRGAVSVMFAAGAIPMIGLVGLAVDFGVWNETNSQLAVAANVAALTAVRVAANANLANDPNWQAEGISTGDQWFASEVAITSRIGANGVKFNTQDGSFGAHVNVQLTGTTITAKVHYNGQVPSIFGFALADIVQYPISGEADAVVTTAPFLNVDILLDNSGSMEIGATDNDVVKLQALTPCSLGAPVPPPGVQPNAPGAFYDGNGNLAGQSYASYDVNGYDGNINPPIAQAYDPPLNFTTFPATGAGEGPQCNYQLPKDAKGNVPNAGPPCAFACHFDLSKPAGTGNDYYAIARSLAGTSNSITLRFDTVKAATNQVIQTMQTDNISSINNLNVGVFTFDLNFHRVYPPPACSSGTACEAGGDFATAIADVGAPPSTPYGPDTGIQPSTAGNGNGNSDFHDTMTNLAAVLSPSGDGTQASTPRKVLFLISDGLVDYTNPTRIEGAVQTSDCDLFKSMGYTVYVVYTPYNAVMNQYYLTVVKPITEPPTTGPLATALQACASSPQDYIAAGDATDLANALQFFLKQALNAPARFTQ